MSDWLPPVDRPLVPDAIEPPSSPDMGRPEGGLVERLFARALGGSKTKHKTINRNRVENHYYGGHDDVIGVRVGPLYAGAFPRKRRRR